MVNPKSITFGCSARELEDVLLKKVINPVIQEFIREIVKVATKQGITIFTEDPKNHEITMLSNIFINKLKL